MSLIALLAVLLLGTGEAAAHGGQHDDWLTKWTFDPLVVVPLTIGTLLYAIGGVRLYNRGVDRKLLILRGAAFGAGVCALVVALVAPIHWLGGQLFAWHMIEHQVIMVIAPPLIVLGRPRGPLIWGLPMRWQAPAGRFVGRVTRARWATPLKSIAGATALHALALWIWHLPILYEGALDNDLTHWLQHVSFMSTALLFWWAVLRRGAAAGLVAPLAILVTSVHSMFLALLIIVSTEPLYPSQTKSPSPWTALDDQQLAGLVMATPVGFVYLLAALIVAERSLMHLRSSRGLTPRCVPPST